MPNETRHGIQYHTVPNVLSGSDRATKISSEQFVWLMAMLVTGTFVIISSML
jgi:hypothetical protein